MECQHQQQYHATTTHARVDDQQAEYFGPDCSLRRCPSGKDPTVYNDTEDGYQVSAEGGRGVGLYGNKVHSECSNQGNCNRATGECECFPSFVGVACEGKERVAGQVHHIRRFDCTTYECVHAFEEQLKGHLR